MKRTRLVPTGAVLAACLAAAGCGGCGRANPEPAHDTDGSSPSTSTAPSPSDSAAAVAAWRARHPRDDAGNLIPKSSPPPVDSSLLPPKPGREPDWDLDASDAARDYVRRYALATKRYGASLECVDIRPSTRTEDRVTVEVRTAATCPGAGTMKDVFVVDVWIAGKAPMNAISGGKLLFGPDGTLYVTVGDRDPLSLSNDASIRMKAQDLGSHTGKTLRIRDDGSVPSDNPFVNKAGAKPEIFSYGHRNGYGLAFHPTTGALWQAEIGPFGGDEINILLPGRNYGWPLVSFGRNYTGTLVSDEPYSRPGLEMPQLFFTPSISPSSIIFYTGNQFPSWKGSLIISTLSTDELRRVGFNQQGKEIRGHELMLSELGQRFREVVQGPDGNLYVATETRYGDSSNKGTVLRIEPAK